MGVAVLGSPSAGRGRTRLATTAVRGALRAGGLAPPPAVTECVPGASTVVGTDRRWTAMMIR